MCSPQLPLSIVCCMQSGVYIVLSWLKKINPYISKNKGDRLRKKVRVEELGRAFFLLWLFFFFSWCSILQWFLLMFNCFVAWVPLLDEFSCIPHQLHQSTKACLTLSSSRTVLMWFWHCTGSSKPGHVHIFTGKGHFEIVLKSVIILVALGMKGILRESHAIDIIWFPWREDKCCVVVTGNSKKKSSYLIASVEVWSYLEGVWNGEQRSFLVFKNGNKRQQFPA